MCECKRRLEYANCISGERGYIRKIVYCEEKSWVLFIFFLLFLVNPIIGVTWGVSTRRPRALPKRFSLRDHSLTRKLWISRAWILFHPCEPHKLKKNYIMYTILIFCLLFRFLLQKQGESLVYLRWLEFLFLFWRSRQRPHNAPVFRDNILLFQTASVLE